jgi:hypothetical protein
MLHGHLLLQSSNGQGLVFSRLCPVSSRNLILINLLCKEFFSSTPHTSPYDLAKEKSRH